MKRDHTEACTGVWLCSAQGPRADDACLQVHNYLGLTKPISAFGWRLRQSVRKCAQCSRSKGMRFDAGNILRPALHRYAADTRNCPDLRDPLKTESYVLVTQGKYW